MDADLFTPADTAALLAIKAVMANRRLSPAELRALFDATGLTPQPTVFGAGVEKVRSFLRSARLH
jgi:hypothetical protein